MIKMPKEKAIFDYKSSEVSTVPVLLESSHAVAQLKLLKSNGVIHLSEIVGKISTTQFHLKISLKEYVELISKSHLKTHHCFQCELNQKTIQSHTYCFQCRKWYCLKCLSAHSNDDLGKDHCLLSYELDIKVDFLTSYTNLNHYCYSCLCLFPADFVSLHQKHHCFFVISELEQQINRTFTSFLKELGQIRINNKKWKEKIMLLLEKKSCHEYKKLKSKLQFAYEANDKNNELLFEYIKLTHRAYEEYKQKKALMVLLNLNDVLNINTKEPEINWGTASLTSNCLSLIDYFNSNYIIRINQGIECLTQLSGAYHNMNYSLLELVDRRIAIGGKKGRLNVLDPTHLTIIGKLKGHSRTVLSLYQLLDTRLVSGAKDKQIRLWSIDDLTCVAVLTDKALTPPQGFVQLKNSHLVSASDSLQIWDITTSSCLRSLNEYHITAIISLSDGRISIGSSESKLEIWDALLEKCQLTMHLPYSIGFILQVDANTIALNPLINDQKVSLWNIHNGCCVRNLKYTSGVNRGLILLNNDTLLATFDEELYLMKLHSSVIVCAYVRDHHNIHCLAQLSDSKIMVVARKSILIWK